MPPRRGTIGAELESIHPELEPNESRNALTLDVLDAYQALAAARPPTVGDPACRNFIICVLKELADTNEDTMSTLHRRINKCDGIKACRLDNHPYAEKAMTLFKLLSHSSLAKRNATCRTSKWCSRFIRIQLLFLFIGLGLAWIKHQYSSRDSHRSRLRQDAETGIKQNGTQTEDELQFLENLRSHGELLLPSAEKGWFRFIQNDEVTTTTQSNFANLNNILVAEEMFTMRETTLLSNDGGCYTVSTSGTAEVLKMVTNMVGAHQEEMAQLLRGLYPGGGVPLSDTQKVELYDLKGDIENEFEAYRAASYYGQRPMLEVPRTSHNTEPNYMKQVSLANTTEPVYSLHAGALTILASTIATAFTEGDANRMKESVHMYYSVLDKLSSSTLSVVSIVNKKAILQCSLARVAAKLKQNVYMSDADLFSELEKYAPVFELNKYNQELAAQGEAATKAVYVLSALAFATTSWHLGTTAINNRVTEVCNMGTTGINLGTTAINYVTEASKPTRESAGAFMKSATESVQEGLRGKFRGTNATPDSSRTLPPPMPAVDHLDRTRWLAEEQVATLPSSQLSDSSQSLHVTSTPAQTVTSSDTQSTTSSMTDSNTKSDDWSQKYQTETPPASNDSMIDANLRKLKATALVTMRDISPKIGLLNFDSSSVGFYLDKRFQSQGKPGIRAHTGQLHQLDYIPFQATFFMVATIQYLTAEIIDISVNCSFFQARWTSEMSELDIKTAILQDEEMEDILIVNKYHPVTINFSIGIKEVFQQIALDRTNLSNQGVKYINLLLNNILYRLTNLALSYVKPDADQFEAYDFAQALIKITGLPQTYLQHTAIENAEMFVERAVAIQGES